jgi:hypothetical protein
MALVDEEERRRAERAHQVALFRYQLVREAADAALSPRQRGVMVREIAFRTHTDPFGRPVRVTRGTLDRWLRSWREGGFDALLPPTRQVTPRTPGGIVKTCGWCDGWLARGVSRSASGVGRSDRPLAAWQRALRVLGVVAEEITWLAVQGLTDAGESREADCLCAPVLQDGQVDVGDSNALSQFSESHAPVGEKPIEVDFDGVAL